MSVRRRIFIQCTILSVLLLTGRTAAEELEEFSSILWNFSSTRVGSLPPFRSEQADFRDPSAKPIESQTRFQFVERSILLKSSYQERNLFVGPLVGDIRKRPIYSVNGTSDLVGTWLTNEAELAYNTLDAKTAGSLGRETAKMFRLGLKGDWHGYKYGGEYRSLDKGFVHFRDGEAERSEDLSQIWGETNFGPLRLRATFAQLWENINESRYLPRLTRSSLVSSSYKKGDWETILSSAYSLRADRFRDGSLADVLSHELRTTYQPMKDLKITPMIQFAGEWNRTSGIRTEAPSTSLTLAYHSWRNIFNFVSSTSYNWSQTSDRLAQVRDLRTTASMIWNLGDAFHGRRTLTYEFSYSNHLDAVVRGNSNNLFATRLLLTVHRF